MIQMKGKKMNTTKHEDIGLSKEEDRNCNNCGYFVPEKTQLASQPKCNRPIDNISDDCRSYAKWIPTLNEMMSEISKMGKISEISKKFEINSYDCKDLMCLKCPDCKNIFGLATKWIEEMEILIKFKCPYCGSEHAVNNT